MKATCLTFGPAFSAAAIEPLFLEASTAPDWDPSRHTCPHVSQVGRPFLSDIGSHWTCLQQSPLLHLRPKIKSRLSETEIASCKLIATQLFEWCV